MTDDRCGTQAQSDAAADLAASGQRDARIVVVDYDPACPGRFADELARLVPLLPGAEVHHIGSTAVPGLAAKPVIDVMALVDDLDARSSPRRARRLRVPSDLQRNGSPLGRPGRQAVVHERKHLAVEA